MADRHRVKMRSIRVPDDLWAALKVKAADEGRPVTAVLLRLIRRYLNED